LLTIADESGHILSDGRLKVLGAIFYGYSAALLGITGFESAANYVESLDNTKTFVSTVNWLWVLVGIFNPCLSIVSMMVLPMEKIYESPSELLAIMAEKVGGSAFSQAVCVDAVLVLCGAVLTSFVGVSGLLVRLSNDKVLPAFVAISTSSGSPVVASILFFLISVSLFVILFDPTNSQQISAFGGVYAIAFLCVLVAFASSAIMLKLNRSNMARLVIARWWEIYLSLFAVAAGLIGNITLTPKVFILFLIYLVAFSAVCAYMFLRVDLFSFAIWMVRF
jgi:amino acid transporter